jgi:hypothetical protein
MCLWMIAWRWKIVFSRAGRFRKEVLRADLEPVMWHDLEENGRFCDGDGEMQVILEFC